MQAFYGEGRTHRIALRWPIALIATAAFLELALKLHPVDQGRVEHRGLMSYEGEVMTAVSSVSSFQDAPDEEILNFVLNLEYLQATYYAISVTGQDLASEDIGSHPGTVTGGGRVSFVNPVINSYALEIAEQEATHVRILREILGTAAVSRPDIDLRNSFNLFGRAAFDEDLNPYANDTNFLVGSYLFEDVVVTAYRGALSLLRDRSYVDVVAGIIIAEAYHAAIIRSSLFATQVPLVSNVTMAISQTRSALANSGNPDVDDHGIGTLSKPSVINTDQSGIGHVRDTKQILNIVYGNSERIGNGGAFFPRGMNGKIR